MYFTQISPQLPLFNHASQEAQQMFTTNNTSVYKKRPTTQKLDMVNIRKKDFVPTTTQIINCTNFKH